MREMSSCYFWSIPEPGLAGYSYKADGSRTGKQQTEAIFVSMTELIFK